MALELKWTPRAEKGYNAIIEYLDLHFTEREIKNFVIESSHFFDLLLGQPQLLRKSNKGKNIRRGPMNKYTMITYRVKPRKNQLELLNIRSTRQEPQ